MKKVTDYKIVISPKASENERRAASFIRDNIRLVCGKVIPVVYDTEAACENEIVVGVTNREISDNMSFKRYRDSYSGGVWEYTIQSVGNRLYVTGLGIAPETEPPYTTAYRHLDDGMMNEVNNAIAVSFGLGATAIADNTTTGALSELGGAII